MQNTNYKHNNYDTKTMSSWEHNDIIECAARNDFDGVNAALEADPSCINLQRSGIEVSALMVASGFGLERMVSHLLGVDGVDIYLRDSSGMNAIEHGRIFPGIVRLLLDFEHPIRAWEKPQLLPQPR